jgi:hypothetical protein
MGQSPVKYSVNGLTDLSKELDINVNNIQKCELMKLINYEYEITIIDNASVIDDINQMKSCNHIYTNYIYNIKHRITLTFKDNSTCVLALSDCGKYVGKPTRASGMGLWFYLVDNNGKYYTSFEHLIL